MLILIISRFGTEPMVSSATTVMAWKRYLSYVFLNPPLCIHVKGVRIHQLLHIKELSNCWPSISASASAFIHLAVYPNISSFTGRAQRIEILSSHITKIQITKYIKLQVAKNTHLKRKEKRKKKDYNGLRLLHVLHRRFGFGVGQAVREMSQRNWAPLLHGAASYQVFHEPEIFRK